MSCRTIKRFLFVSGIVVFFVTLALAVNPGLVFEIDGNVFDTAGNGIDDWNTLNGDCTIPGGGSGAPGGSLARTCIASEDPPAIFTTGGSKDPLDISSWRWKPADTVPDKDTITHAFAASYNNTNTGGDKVLFAGGDRFATNGDANIGAWFFQNSVSTNTNGTFSGVHKDHDVFLVSAFVGGGGTAVLTAYEWDHTCAKGVKNPTPGQCAESNLRLLGSTDTAAITNSQVITDQTWSYLSKFGGSTNTIPVGAFFEGGADLTVLFGGIGAGTVPCFSSFLLETRSSQTPSAVLKDFVLGSFPECKVSITKSCQCTAFHTDGSGYDYQFGGTVSNDGGGTLTSVTVTDQGKTYSCGTLAPKGSVGSTKNWPTDCTGPAATFSDTVFPSTNQAHVDASTGATTISADTDVITCSAQVPTGACTPNPSLTVDKTCVTALQVLGTNVVVRVDYTGQVHNGGNVNINSVAVTEDDNADSSIDHMFTVGTLTPSGTAGADKCYTYTTAQGLTQPTCPAFVAVPVFNSTTPVGAASYFPSTGTGVDPGRVQFSDTVRATGTDAFGHAVESHPSGSGVTAHCKVCPFGACPATVAGN